jgi:hypothetical protein
MYYSTRSFLFGLIIVLTISMSACKSSTSDPTSTGNHNGASEWVCGTYKGHTLYTGPQGGCYYYNSNGNKSYVDRSNCNC